MGLLVRLRFHGRKRISGTICSIRLFSTVLLLTASQGLALSLYLLGSAVTIYIRSDLP